MHLDATVFFIAIYLMPRPLCLRGTMHKVDMLSALQGGDSGDGVPVPATLCCCPEGNMRLGFRSCNPHAGGFTPIASATASPPRTHAFTGVTFRMPYGRLSADSRKSLLV